MSIALEILQQTAYSQTLIKEPRRLSLSKPDLIEVAYLSPIAELGVFRE